MTLQTPLIWLDMEMTGLNPETDRIIEVGLLVTDSELNIIAQAPTWVIYQDTSVLATMDEWNKSTHQKSGLIAKINISNLTEQIVEKAMLDFMRQYSRLI